MFILPFKSPLKKKKKKPSFPRHVLVISLKIKNEKKKTKPGTIQHAELLVTVRNNSKVAHPIIFLSECGGGASKHRRGLLAGLAGRACDSSSWGCDLESHAGLSDY